MNHEHSDRGRSLPRLQHLLLPRAAALRLAFHTTATSLVVFGCNTESGIPNEEKSKDPAHVPDLGTGGEVVDGGGGLSNSGGTGAASGGTSLASGGGPSASPLVIEEEEAGQCSVDGIVESSNAGFSGSGYLNTDNAAGSAITWSIDVGQDDTYSLTFVYANPAEDRPARLLVDETPQEASISFATTADWSTWSAVSVELPLAPGTHRLTLEANDASGLANIDRIEISGAEVGPGECEVEDGPDGTDPITIWLAGDSTVAGGSTPCPSGWGKFFASEFNENVSVTNRAVGGRSVRTWLYDVTDTMGGDGECVLNTNGMGNPIIQDRWTEMLDQMEAGDYLFIQFGINDGSGTCPRHVGGQAFKDEYAMMAQAAYDRGAQPVFLTPVSAIKCSGNTAVGSRGFLTETFDVGAAEGVPVIDLHQLSVDLYQDLGFCPVPGGDVSAGTTGPVGDFFCDDHTHFSDIGAAQIAGLIADAIASSDPGLSAYLE